jgi:hypothetical protein
VQLVVRLSPLEQDPVHTALRPLDTRMVTDVPLVNGVVPVLPVRTLTPVGVETTAKWEPGMIAPADPKIKPEWIEE